MDSSAVNENAQWSIFSQTTVGIKNITCKHLALNSNVVTRIGIFAF